MPDPRDEELILYYYGETSQGDDMRRRLEASPAVAERYDELCRTLELVESQPVPEPWDDYGERVWRRLEPRLKQPATGRGAGRKAVREWLGARFANWFAARRLASVASVAVLVALAFLAGRYWPADRADPGRPQVASDLAAEGRERILLVSVGEHLERSKMLLIELVNAPTDGAADLSGELRRAEELLPFNRLYRQAAQRSGQAAVVEVLDELERLLLDLAHSGDLAAADLNDLRQRIDRGGILFRVQVVGSRVEHQNRRQQQHRSPDTIGDV